LVEIWYNRSAVIRLAHSGHEFFGARTVCMKKELKSSVIKKTQKKEKK